MTKALVPLAEGVEEMEAAIIVDVLRRAKWEVITAAVTPQPITASRGLRLLADADWATVHAADFDILVIPGGGGGTQQLMRSASVLDTVRAFRRAGKPVAAICAGPLVLQAAGILKGIRATCFPGVAADLTAAHHVSERVAIDQNIITSQGPGTAFEFALALIAHVDGPQAVEAVAPGLILPS